MSVCGVCGRTLDDCGTCVCASRYSLAQERPLDAFLHYAVATCVGPAALPSLEVAPEGATCSTCGANWRLSGPCDECQEASR